MNPLKLASTTECYNELLRIKEERLKILRDHQQEIRHHEQSLTLIKNRLAKSLRKVHFVESKMNKFIDNDVWVTAEQHELIYSVRDKVAKEYSDLLRLKKERHEIVDEQAKAAKLVAGHVMGIQRGLVTLQQQLQKESLEISQRPEKNSKGSSERWWSLMVSKNKTAGVIKPLQNNF